MLKSSTKQKKVIKKMKDETKDIPIAEFIALKNKMHSFIKIDDKGGKKPKGVNENVT